LPGDRITITVITPWNFQISITASQSAKACHRP
jgi:acyl-CoA reductase-like NAD-dependent aldehyde dehydrogenase